MKDGSRWEHSHTGAVAGFEDQARRVLQLHKIVSHKPGGVVTDGPGKPRRALREVMSDDQIRVSPMRMTHGMKRTWPAS